MAKDYYGGTARTAARTASPYALTPQEAQVRKTMGSLGNMTPIESNLRSTMRSIYPQSASAPAPYLAAAVRRTNVAPPQTAYYKPNTVQVAPTAVPTIAVNPGQFDFRGGGAMGANVGQAQQGDWGMDAAGQAQVQLIKDWMVNELIPAAREQEIARGMGRSGIAMGLEAEQTRKASLEATNAMAQAAAEQGRLNQEVAISNAGNELGRETANQSALIEMDKVRNGWEQFVNDLSFRTQNANAGWGLDYKSFDETQRVNRENANLAGSQQSLAAWLGGQNASQGWTGIDVGQQQNALDRANALSIANIQAMGGGGGAASYSPAAQFQKDMPNLAADIEAQVAETGAPLNGSALIARLKAQYPGVDPMQFPALADLIDRAARGAGIPGALVGGGAPAAGNVYNPRG